MNESRTKELNLTLHNALDVNENRRCMWIGWEFPDGNPTRRSHVALAVVIISTNSIQASLSSKEVWIKLQVVMQSARFSPSRRVMKSRCDVLGANVSIDYVAVGKVIWISVQSREVARNQVAFGMFWWSCRWSCCLRAFINYNSRCCWYLNLLTFDITLHHSTPTSLKLVRI